LVKKNKEDKDKDNLAKKSESSKNLIAVSSPVAFSAGAGSSAFDHEDDKKPKYDIGMNSAGSPSSSSANISTIGSSSNISANSSANPVKSDKPDSELVELVTIYAYDATEENELTFAEGETIFLIEKDESGWWRGRNKKGVEGVFPSNFVEVVGEEGGGGTSGTVEINADYTALYDYEAEDDTELTIKEGEILHVISETDGWYFGTNAQGQKGNFPSNFVERLETKS